MFTIKLRINHLHDDASIHDDAKNTNHHLLCLACDNSYAGAILAQTQMYLLNGYRLTNADKRQTFLNLYNAVLASFMYSDSATKCTENQEAYNTFKTASAAAYDWLVNYEDYIDLHGREAFAQNDALIANNLYDAMMSMPIEATNCTAVAAVCSSMLSDIIRLFNNNPDVNMPGYYRDWLTNMKDAERIFSYVNIKTANHSTISDDIMINHKQPLPDKWIPYLKDAWNWFCNYIEEILAFYPAK